MAVEAAPPAVVTAFPAGAPVSGSTPPAEDPGDPESPGEPVGPFVPGAAPGDEPGCCWVLGPAADDGFVPPAVVVVVCPVVLLTVQLEPSFMHLLGIGAE